MKWIAFAPRNSKNLGGGVFEVMAANRATAEALAKMPNNTSVLSIWQQKIAALGGNVTGEPVFTLDRIEALNEGTKYNAFVTIYLKQAGSAELLVDINTVHAVGEGRASSSGSPVWRAGTRVEIVEGPVQRENETGTWLEYFVRHDGYEGWVNETALKFR